MAFLRTARRRDQGAAVRRVLVVAVRLWGTCLAGCGDPQIVVPDVLRVIAILPAHGSTGIATDVEPLVYFSHPLADPDGVAASVGLSCAGSPPCADPDAAACPATPANVTPRYDAAEQLVRLSVDGATPLASATCYEITVGEGLGAAARDVAPLPASIRSRFQTR